MPDELYRTGGESSGALPGGPPRCAGCARERTRTNMLGDVDTRPLVTSPDVAAEVLEPWLSGRDRERCVAALLDTKHRLLDVVVVSVGTIDHTFMNPREILRDALLGNAAALVVAHNHPSGDPQPSPDDRAVTRRLGQACHTLGIELLDHLVVGGQRWVSMARMSLL